MPIAQPSKRRLFVTWLIAVSIGSAAGFAAAALWDYLTNDTDGGFSPQIVVTAVTVATVLTLAPRNK